MPEESKGPDPVSAPPEAAEAAKAKQPPVEPGAASAAAKAAPGIAPTPTSAAKTAAASTAAATPVAPAGAAPVPKPAAAPPKPAGPTPEPWESELVTELRRRYGPGIVEASRYLGQRYLVVDSSILQEILLAMRDREGFDYCADITAVHYPKREQQFDIVYVLYSFPKNERIRVKTRVKDGDHIPSAFPIWPTANWLEREVFDMFGIVFDGHPGLKRILLPEDWHGHPLRKDYDILQQDREWVQINLGIESGQ